MRCAGLGLSTGWGRRLPLVAGFLPVLCLASAAGPAPWSKVELSAWTTLGVVELSMDTASGADGFHLDRVQITIAGKRLRLPRGVDLRVPRPHLNDLQIETTRTATCIDDCPDTSDWPIYLKLPFGNPSGATPGGSRQQAEECRFSMLSIHIEADGVADITVWACEGGRQHERNLYSRDDAGAD